MGRREFIKIKYNMIQDKLSEISEKYGVNNAIKAVGNIDRYIKIMYNGDLSNFYKKSNLFDIFKFPFINKVNRYSQQRQ